MSRNDEEKEEVTFSQKEIDTFRSEFEKYDTEQAFYLAKKVIRLDEHGSWIVLRFPCEVEDPITGLSAGDIPFRFYRKLKMELERQDSVKNYREKKVNEHYEEQAASMTEEDLFSHNAYKH